jgi:ActR/RegA family two-component response regulator
MAPIRMLFVDDEPALRLTFPAILKEHNFEVHSAATVAEALNEINSGGFDVLVADLNIGEPGDGFTVVSAMRRTHPDCVNFILTGYPAFESALEAIRSQVDDYLIKPCDAVTLVSAIEQKLQNPKARRRMPAKRLSTFIRDNHQAIMGKTIHLMKAHRHLGALPLSEKQRVGDLPNLLLSAARKLEPPSTSGLPQSGLSDDARQMAAAHGRTRRDQGYTLPMIVDDIRLIEQAIYDLVQQNLLELDLSYLIADLRRLNDSLEDKLQESLYAYLEEKAA